MVTGSPDLLGKGIFTFGYIWACLFPGSDNDSTNVLGVKECYLSSQSLGSYFWQLSVRKGRRDERRGSDVLASALSKQVQTIYVAGTLGW